MRIGVVSDIHGNRPALEAVLTELPAVDRLLCAGDIVGYNPSPRWCVEQCRSSMVCVQGNHDRAIERPTRYRHNEQAYQGLVLAREQLTAEQRDWLTGLPTERTLCDGQLRMIHSHPSELGRYVRPPQFPTLESHLGSEAVLILGHTHIQHTERVGDTLVVNPGSVGQPRDKDPRAAFAVVDTTEWTVDTHRVSYDIDQVRSEIAVAGLPERTGSRLAVGK